jgi:hypothetical protein
MRWLPLLTIVLILSLASPALAQDWIEFSSRADFFTVNLPGEPKVKEITYPTEYSITLPGRVYTYEDGADRYSVTVVDYSSTVKKHADLVVSCKAAGNDGDICNERSAIDSRGAMIYASWHLIEKAAKVDHYVFTNADLVEGHELHLTNADGSRTFAAIYMHEDRLYILEATVPPRSAPPLLFQQSMQFLDQDGKSIRYRSLYTNGYNHPARIR